MKTALALGTFDGLHIAHREVLSLPCEYKKTAVTFLCPPKMFFNNNYELLMTFENKVKALNKIGFEVEAFDFSEVKDMKPMEFLEFLLKKYTPSLISCGFNYCFGKDGEGDTALLKSFCQNKGIECRICEEIDFNGKPISSSVIRNMLKNGEIAKANSLLLEPFSFEAIVEHGDSRGRTIDFPTINQKYPQELVKVKFGVYKTKVSFNGTEYDGITNIGLRPTFKSDYVISETYIKDFSGDLYGKNIRIQLVKFLREEKKFYSLEDLKQQINIDIKN